METLTTFFILLFVFACLVIGVGLAMFAIVWMIIAIVDARKQAKIQKDWRDSA